jgi:hypothetical protein
VDTVKDPAEMPIGGMNYSHPANPESLRDDSVVSEIPHGTSICPGLPTDNANRRMVENYHSRLSHGVFEFNSSASLLQTLLCGKSLQQGKNRE